MFNKTKTALLSGLILSGLCSTAQAKEIVLRALMEDVPETTIIEKMLPEFENKYHIKVEFEKIGYGDMHDKLVPQLISPQSYYNLLEVDFLWAGEFSRANWLTDLTPRVKKSGFDISAFIPSTVKLLNTDPKKIELIPMYNYSMGMIYRTDMLKDKHLQAKYQATFNKPLELPKTLDDYVTLVKFIKQQTGNPGAAMQGQRGDPNSMEFSNYLFSAGGDYLNADNKVVLDNAAGKKAMGLYVDAIKNGAQTGALSATLDDTIRLMCSGKAFSMVSYWWMLPTLDNPKTCPAVAGKLALSTMPGGHGESGGWGWGIPKNTTDKEKAAAWTFIQWVQSKDISTARALEGHAPVRADVYKDASVLAKYPYYADAEKVVASGKSFPIFTYSAKYEDVLGTALSQVAGGSSTIDDALTQSADQLKKLMKK
ncbi:extracellular solute-binding protein [Pectobacteriaceae bacterium C52]|uniref:ABC transporter substrate-binding protein n=1 Tax=Serratia sp. (strain ATCC 39006) TaxID=104623 RepID=A0A2I5TK90_SERS3|nr:extracellular solute-binding protein [Serratia sp. ATCC 39006]AUH00658.1 ABC transporter substrate-binding protein [Serratia sp. ATCC 39006]AUH04979.1 ABC transporter substrate-binding protein [Serratia sp. ATCC 39006]WJV60672.1 extracellular solute-binding protein [Pectobacteriaceae bacterium C52]